MNVELPEGFEPREPLDGIALLAVDARGPDSRFRANLVLTIEEVEPGTTVGDYTDAALRTQDELLHRHRLIDREAVTAACTRTLSHHAPDRMAVTIEQWRVVRDSLAYTLTASCATLDYAAYADPWRTAAESLERA